MNPNRIAVPLSILLSLAISSLESKAQEPRVREIYLEPIFHVDYGDATADKPQSKSWSHDHQHWVIVGDKDGPKLLKQDQHKWVSQTAINLAWNTLPSRADVWAEEDEVDIVLVAPCALTVVKLEYAEDKRKYVHKSIVHLPIPLGCETLETATITRDSKNQFWVCADVNEEIMIWHSTDGQAWEDPFELAGDINRDDISLVVHLQNQVSVIWSNQNTQSIIERIHHDGDPPNQWSAPIIIQEGENNADDHLNATVFKDGEMMVVTKNSVDILGKPQFVLRRRDQAGKWTNTPYENLTNHRSPSRPIINHIETGEIFEMHSVRDRMNNQYFISVNRIRVKEGNMEFEELVQLKTAINGKNGDVTSCKQRFSSDEAKLIFFSDDLGNIYAFDLDRILE